jgi:hypothetical protein
VLRDAGGPGLPHHGRVEILLWLLPSVVVTCLAAAWAAWAGRERGGRERSAADQERLAAALQRPLPQRAPRPARARERSTGVAVRPSARGDQTRRSA